MAVVVVLSDYKAEREAAQEQTATREQMIDLLVDYYAGTRFDTEFDRKVRNGMRRHFEEVSDHHLEMRYLETAAQIGINNLIEEKP